MALSNDELILLDNSIKKVLGVNNTRFSVVKDYVITKVTAGTISSKDLQFRMNSVIREAIDSITDGTFSAEKVEGWMKQLETVYNRGFWSGYYLGQELGEWSPNSGSSATQKKIYIGKGRHFYPKSNIAEFLIEAYDLNIGDRVLIQGPTTGSQEIVIEHMMVDGKEGAAKASKSDVVTFKTKFRVRPSDKLYKIVKVEELGTQQNNVDKGTYSH
jgi:putative protease